MQTSKIALACAIGALVVGCTTVPASSKFIAKEPVITKSTRTQHELQLLPPPSSAIAVAVYSFEDKTGQFKPTEAGQTLSRAVSQGGSEILVKALQDAGQRKWFTVMERSNLNNLLKERQIITEMRSRYLGETTVNSKALPPLLFAGIIFEGGIIGYDANTATGGIAARYLGIGGKTDYRQNVVTVNLRAVSVKTGEILASVTTEKTIASVGVAANAFRFVTFDNLLEADAGITSNEPGVLALRQAIEKSVYAMILEGSENGLWAFQDQSSGTALLDKYRSKQGGIYATKKQKKPKKFAKKPKTKSIGLAKLNAPLSEGATKAKSNKDKIPSVSEAKTLTALMEEIEARVAGTTIKDRIETDAVSQNFILTSP